MSLYNMMCGNNPLFGLLARVLETAGPLPEVPRWRDTYTHEIDGCGQVEIVLYTRTGGGNREEYAEQNEAMRQHPCFDRDFNDEFDNTFAHWVFIAPEEFQDQLLKLHRLFSRHPKGCAPGLKFKVAMALLEDKPLPPEVPEELSEEEITELTLLIAEIAIQLPNESSLEKALAPMTKVRTTEDEDEDSDN